MAKKLGCASCGGTKKMGNGGPINKPMTYAKPPKGGSNIDYDIFGVPNSGMTGPNRNSPIETMKKGGSVSSRAVQSSCKQGYVRSASGKCVKKRARFGD